MYKLYKNSLGEINIVIRLTDNAYIPFDPDNTDHQQFKSDLASGTELQDPDGNIMTPDAVKSFLESLP